METRSKAAKTAALRSSSVKRLREEHESVNSVDSGIYSCDKLTASPSSSKIKKSENHSQKNSKKKLVQSTASRSQNNFSDVDKENDGSVANGQQNGHQRNKSSAKKTQITKKSSKQNVSKPEGNSVVEEEIGSRRSQCEAEDWKDRLKWLQPRRAVGLWIQCCRENCGKWRFNDAIHDPVDVPKIWYCSMQSDPRVADCDYPQEEMPPSDISEDVIENEYNAGSIVWSRLDGYPWWPAMVDDCPFNFRYYELKKESNIPIKYNVTFFDVGKVQCSWIPSRNLRPYKLNPKEVFLKRKRMVYGGVSYKDQVLRACEIADEASQLPLYERLERFSLVARLTKDVQAERTKRSTGPSNRTRPVKLRTSVATQMEVCGENLTIPSEPPAQQTGSFDESSIQFSDSISEVHHETSGQQEGEMKRPSSVVSNNESPRIKRVSVGESSTQASCGSNSAVRKSTRLASKEKTAKQPQERLVNGIPIFPRSSWFSVFSGSSTPVESDQNEMEMADEDLPSRPFEYLDAMLKHFTKIHSQTRI